QPVFGRYACPRRPARPRHPAHDARGDLRRECHASPGGARAMNIVIRKFIAGGAFSGAASVLIATLGKGGFNIGALTWLTTIIATGVMMALYGIMNERKEHALQFVLSLPLSIAGYVRAKMIGLTASFLVVWAVSCAAALLLVFVKDSVPDGLAVYLVLLCVFMLANFAVVLCGAMQARTEALNSAVIVVTNMGVSIFMFT